MAVGEIRRSMERVKEKRQKREERWLLEKQEKNVKELKRKCQNGGGKMAVG